MSQPNKTSQAFIETPKLPPLPELDVLDLPERSKEVFVYFLL